MSILNSIVHRRLIEDLDNVCETANIPKHMIHKSAREYMKDDSAELQWIMNYAKNKDKGRGLVITGKSDENKLMALTAVLLRNFIDARVISVNTLIETGVNPTVCVVPNLYVVGVGKAIPAWKIQTLYDLLLARYTANRLTIAYVETLDGVQKDYGSVFARHLRDHYEVVGG